MKRINWQRLATIGLCSSLVINAFAGVTAVAETVTSESSPTVASSAMQESTESSQETTETSREEVTQETEKQAEIPEVKTETTESVPENSSENDRQKSISPRWVPNDQVIYPRMIFGFTDETGKAFADENLTLSGTYYKLARHTATSQWRPYADRYPIVSSNAGGGQYRVAVNATIPMPYDFLTNLPAGYTHNLYAIEQLKIDNTLKYVDSIVAPPGSINRTRYSEQQTSEAAQFGNYVTGSLTQRDRTFSKNSANIFSLNSLALAPEITDVLTMLRTDSIERGPILIGFDGTTTYRETLNYVVTRKQVTEKFVDTNGVAITPPTGFTQNKKTPMTSNDFTFKQSSTLPDTYQAGGKTYKFKGWYKGKTKPNTLTTSTTPTYNTTFDGNDDMTAVYKEANISANLTMRGAVDVIDNGATMEYWEVLLKNTGEAPLTSVKIKPTTDWAAGISTPTELFILGTGQNTKVRPITKEQWEAGFEIPLDSSLPVGGQLTINLLGTKVTGQPNQVLKAAVEVTGNFNKLTASDTVRIKDLDQETKEPTGEGFISVPTFNFGQVGVAGSTQQHSLKKAADYYGNGTRNPYLRIKKTQPNWSLTAQLSQPKSATDSLPTTTRLLLGTAAAASFTDYNQPTETKTPLGKTGTVNLTADNTATAVVANQQFTGSDVYQLDFTFANIKLEVPANQGMVGQQYQAAVTWNLVTGP
ncbi:WxL domain-containing protein [Enterococcus faecalis]|uniref:WxL domain-containing protein n=1 Tax=Enterococcus faecalis TaxID=1351 RepID=UPI00293573C8|nr:WxL domain-containing protein [Enterococcus faecalis]MDV2539202.1 WxL domain-containing protein [Enterococcus faecalis]MDV2552588.1 WxL domain-containing protein [Enterococcus faecalis]